MKKLTVKGENTFFTADTHFFHKNVVKLSKRPYNTTEEMNEALIQNWNNVVSNEDDVFILGDFAFTSNIGIIKNLLSKLNGRKRLVLGNHCKI